MELTVNLTDESMDKLADKLADKVAFLNSTSNTTNRKLLIPTDKEIIYSVTEVAEMTKQSDSTITKHIRDGLLKGYKPGRSWKIKRQDYLKYINNGNSNN